MTSVIPNKIQGLTLGSASEQDWFSLNLQGQRGDNDNIAIGFASGAPVIGTLYSQNANGQLHTVSVQTMTDTGSQTLSLSGLQPGRYYLAVTGVGGDAPDYSVQVQATTIPTLAPISQQVVPAGSTATFTASVVDSAPGQSFSYSLDPGAPAGAAIDPNTGVFTWTPTSAQAGQTYNFTVRVMENGNPDLSSAQGVAITVTQPTPTKPTNTTVSPPVLQKPPLLSFFDQLLGAIESVNSNGTETVTDSLFGIPLIVSTFDSQGHLMSVTLFGIDVTFLFG